MNHNPNSKPQDWTAFRRAVVEERIGPLRAMVELMAKGGSAGAGAGAAGHGQGNGNGVGEGGERGVKRSTSGSGGGE